MSDKYEGLRVYVVVPGTVQTPIKVSYSPRKTESVEGRTQEIYSFGRFENTRDIVQPAGASNADRARARHGGAPSHPV